MVVVVDGNEASDDEEAQMLALAECRICQEEDSVQNLETPCGCSGNLKYAHRKCVQHWCDEKGDIICEICHQAEALRNSPNRKQLEFPHRTGRTSHANIRAKI